jgi:ABC-2 type transport system ATP-binding protein
MTAIVTSGLSKQYGHGGPPVHPPWVHPPAPVRALEDLSIEVREGEIFGFLGPNGAGKTSTLRMLLGLVRPTSGSVLVLGAAPGSEQALARTGALVETPRFYPFLSGRDNLKVLARHAGVPEGRIAPALEEVDLAARASDRFQTYSLGMKQRLGIAAALLKDPELLILDEPTNGMDPQGTREIRNLVRELAAEGSTVFLSSHLLSEVEQLCTHVGIISVGKMVAQGSVEELRGRGEAMLRVETDDAPGAATVLDRLGLEAITVTGEVVSAQLDGQRPEECTRELVMAGVGVRSLTTDRRSLEDAFVALTGEGFDVAR